MWYAGVSATGLLSACLLDGVIGWEGSCQAQKQEQREREMGEEATGEGPNHTARTLALPCCPGFWAGHGAERSTLYTGHSCDVSV